MPDVLLPFQGLSDPVSAQGSEFTPQFPPQSLDLPSITISRNLVEQDGVLHSSGLHMVGSKLIAWKFSLSFVLLMVKIWESKFWSMLMPVYLFTRGCSFQCPVNPGTTRSPPGTGQESVGLVDSHMKEDNNPARPFWFEMIVKESDSLVWN